MAAGRVSCRACGASVEAGGFCSVCGARLRSKRVVAVVRTEPRVFGVLSPAQLAAAGLVAGALAVVAFVASSWIFGALALVVAVAAAALLVWGVAPRVPAARVVRVPREAAGRVLGWMRFGTAAAFAWFRAGGEVVRLRRELRAVRSDRERLVPQLGRALLAEDEEECGRLLARIGDLDTRAAQLEGKGSRALSSARSRVRAERLAAQRTQIRTP